MATNNTGMGQPNLPLGASSPTSFDPFPLNAAHFHQLAHFFLETSLPLFLVETFPPFFFFLFLPQTFSSSSNSDALPSIQNLFILLLFRPISHIHLDPPPFVSHLVLTRSIERSRIHFSSR